MHNHTLSNLITSAATLALGLAVIAPAAAAPIAFGPAMVRSQVATQQGTGMKRYHFTTLDNQSDPTFNQLLGINTAGTIAGYFGSGAAGHPNQGYTIAPPYGQANYTSENYPGSVQTQVTAIDNSGNTAGFWVDGNNNNFGFVAWHGVFTTYADPNTGSGTVNQILGLNDSGIAAGFYTDGNGLNHAYVVNQKSHKFQELTPPGGNNALATGINNKGDVVGFFTASSGAVVGFLLRHGNYTEFEYPGSTNTTPLGVNDSDQIVGGYADASGGMHGFVLRHGLKNATFQSVDDPNGVGATTINGVNDDGEIVGFYGDAAGNTDGFLALP
jgi:hypothetical protein